MSRKEELPCKGLTVTFIDKILDVTPYVKKQLAKDEDPEGLNYLSPSYLSKVAKRFCRTRKDRNHSVHRFGTKAFLRSQPLLLVCKDHL